MLSEFAVKAQLESAKKDNNNNGQKKADSKEKTSRPKARPKTGTADPGKGLKLGMARAGTT
jgi:hypothetical protein